MTDSPYILGDFGDIHFDDEETFTVSRQDGAVDLRWLALHELGHSLGLAHSSNKRAIMYPIYEESLSGNRLNRDDILGIQHIYGTSIPFGRRKVAKTLYFLVKKQFKIACFLFSL